jgi:hypothetical protein
MPQIKSLEEFKTYLLHRCGAPTLNIEVDKDTQLEDLIFDSIQFFQEYNIGGGSSLEYFLFAVSANQKTYSLSGMDVAGVFDVELSIGIDGINTLFSPSHSILYADFAAIGSSMLGTNSSNPNYSPGLTMTSYDVAMLYLKEIKNQFGRGFTVQYNKNREVLTVNPTPADNMLGVIYLYRKEQAIYLYNNFLVKELGYAKTLIAWGQNLDKYNATMPDGISMKGSEIMQRGLDMEEKVKQEIRDESEPIDFMMG